MLGNQLRGPQSRGDKIRIGRLILTLSRAQKRVKMLCNPYVQMATSTMPSSGPTSGRKYNVTPTLSGVPIGCLTPSFSTAQHMAELPRDACVLGDPQKSKGDKNQRLPPQPCILGGPQVGTNATQPRRSQGPQKRGQDQNRLPHSCLLGGPNELRNATLPLRSRGSEKKRENQKWIPRPCLHGGTQVGGKAT